MKKVIIVLLSILALTASTAFAAATVSMNTSNTSSLKFKLANNTDVSTLAFSVAGLPIKTVTCSDVNKKIDWNITNGKIIIYGYNQIAIANGDVLTVEFTLPQNYGTYNITITPLSASTGTAVSATVTKGADGIIAITFSQANVDTEASVVVGKTTVGGIDLNNDGKIDSVDVQIMSNNVA